MGALSRRKGADGERELARLWVAELGPVARNLAQTREGGHDMEGTGLEGWAVETKRHARATPALLASWWAQAEEQGRQAGRTPALAYRQDRALWQVLVPLSALAPELPGGTGIEWTATLSLPAFCALVRERLTR